jgi:hypothetical protein
MADEEVQETQTQEEIQDSQAEEDAFDEATGGGWDGKKDDVSPADDQQEEDSGPDEKDGQVDDGQKDGGDSKSDDGDETHGKKGKPEPKEKTAQEIADERAKALLGDDDGGGDEHGGDEKPHDAKPEEKQDPIKPDASKPGKLTKENIANFLGILSDDILPDSEIIVGDQSVDLKAYKEDYPDEYATIKVVAGAIAQNMLQNALEQSGFVGKADMDKATSAYESEIQDLRFWQQVSIDHPDAMKVASSKDFTEWLEKQGKGIQALASSTDHEDAGAVLGLYKEHTAKKKAEAHDKNARAKKDKKDALHKGTLKSAGSGKQQQNEGGSENEQAGFDLFFKQKQDQAY